MAGCREKETKLLEKDFLEERISYRAKVDSHQGYPHHPNLLGRYLKEDGETDKKGTQDRLVKGFNSVEHSKDSAGSVTYGDIREITVQATDPDSKEVAICAKYMGIPQGSAQGRHRRQDQKDFEEEKAP